MQHLLFNGQTFDCTRFIITHSARSLGCAATFSGRSCIVMTNFSWKPLNPEIITWPPSQHTPLTASNYRSAVIERKPHMTCANKKFNGLLKTTIYFHISIIHQNWHQHYVKQQYATALLLVLQAATCEHQYLGTKPNLLGQLFTLHWDHINCLQFYLFLFYLRASLLWAKCHQIEKI